MQVTGRHLMCLLTILSLLAAVVVVQTGQVAEGLVDTEQQQVFL
jgi:hypothetical protein